MSKGNKNLSGKEREKVTGGTALGYDPVYGSNNDPVYGSNYDPVYGSNNDPVYGGYDPVYGGNDPVYGM